MRQKIIDAAQSLINAAGFEATRRQISANWDELASDDGRELLRYQLTRCKPWSREYRVIEARLDIIELCIQDGLEVVFADYQEVIESILRLLNADDWDQVCGIVGAERHRLLAPVADVAFADLVMQPASSDDESHVLGGWNLVEQCRELGVEAALQKARDPQRGRIVSVDAAKALVTATTLEDLQRAALAHQDLAPLAQRRLWQAEFNAQVQRWGSSEAYLAERDRLTGPGCEAKRIALCRAALASIDRQTLPLAWTAAALDLAQELRADPAHANAPDQRELISLYSQALAAIGPDDDPDLWGRTQHHLGISYVQDASGDPSANVEAAIKAFEAALTVRRPKVESVDWVKSAVNLAEALRIRTRGDPAVDLERAIVLLEEAIAVAEEHRDADLAAHARVVIGAVLFARAAGRREDNLDRAERELQLAVDSRMDPEIRARAAANLGAVAYERARAEFWNYKTHLEQAESYFRAAVVLVPAASPALRAEIKMGLGAVLSDRADGEIEAIAIYETLLADMGETSPGDVANRARAHHLLGVLYRDLKSDDSRHSRTVAKEHLLTALDLRPAEDRAVERRDTLRVLAMMEFDDRHWHDALEHFTEAIELSDGLLSRSATEVGKHAEAAESRTLYGPCAYCLIQLRRLDEALEILERGKARMLTEALDWKDIDLANLPEAERSEMRWARDEILSAEAASRMADASLDSQLRARLGHRLQDAYRYLAAVRHRVLSSATSDEIDLGAVLRAMPAAGALVMPLVTTQGSSVFVLPGAKDRVAADEVVDLEGVDLAALAALLAGDAGDGGWLNAYLGWKSGAISIEELHGELDVVCDQLWTLLMGPVHDRLEAVGIAADEPIVILPQGWLSLLPLHAATRLVDGERRTFLDDHLVSYAPSARVLRECRRRLESPARHGRALVAAIDPTADLPFARLEGEALAGLFTEEGTLILPRRQATRATMIKESKGRNYFHFACHGVFDWVDPAGSGLELFASRLATVDILAPVLDLGSSRLVTLSGCETGLCEFRTMPDEFIGLPGAFIEAGAPTVISSLWPVDDVSTKLLIAQFYRFHFAGSDVADSLRDAQRWLSRSSAATLDLAAEYRRIFEASEGMDIDARDLASHYEANPDVIPFSRPFYWAAFIATGAC